MPAKTSLVMPSAVLLFIFSGVVFDLAAAQTEHVLYSFCAKTKCSDGAGPTAGVIFDQNGRLYGTTAGGGAHKQGVVFKLTPGGKETVLYSFCAQSSCEDGAYPLAGLVFDNEGNLYGTTYDGGAHGWGVIFKLTFEGKETVLHSFCSRGGCADGARSQAGLVFDQEGNLYGTTAEGGANGGGVVFRVTQDGVYSVLYDFCSEGSYGCSDGAYPLAGLVFDNEGNLYGTTYSGGAGYGLLGVVYKVTPKGKETLLHSFCTYENCADGAAPIAGLIFDQKGNLYGTTIGGGAHGGSSGSGGVVFKLTPKDKETVLYSFCGKTNCADGWYPGAGMVFDQKGNLYGTTEFGGAHGGYGQGSGTVFKLTPEGKEIVVHWFCSRTNCVDGETPQAGLIFDQKGNLYGTALQGGDYNGGVVFKLTP